MARWPIIWGGGRFRVTHNFTEGSGGFGEADLTLHRGELLTTNRFVLRWFRVPFASLGPARSSIILTLYFPPSISPCLLTFICVGAVSCIDLHFIMLRFFFHFPATTSLFVCVWGGWPRGLTCIPFPSAFSFCVFISPRNHIQGCGFFTPPSPF